MYAGHEMHDAYTTMGDAHDVFREEMGERYERRPEYDRRIRRGDDFAGDAWLDQETGKIVWGAVGVDRNRSVK